MPSLAQITALSRQFDAALHQFKAMDLGMSDAERYPSSLGTYDPKKKTYPSIYLSGPKDEFADLPDSGEAVIKYQVTRRSTEEENGKKRHSLTIEVRSLDPKAAAKAQEKKKAEGKAVPISTEFARGDQLVRVLKKFTPPKKDVADAKAHIQSVKADPDIARGGKYVAEAARGLRFLRKAGVMKRKKIGQKETAVLLDGVAASRPKQFSTFARPRDGDGQFVANVTGGADPVTMRQAYGQDPKKANLLAPGAAAAALGGSAALLGTKAGRGLVLKGAKGAARMVRSTVTGIERKAKGRSTERYPVMGSKAPKKAVERPGLGEVLIRQRMRGD